MKLLKKFMSMFSSLLNGHVTININMPINIVIGSKDTSIDTGHTEKRISKISHIEDTTPKTS